MKKAVETIQNNSDAFLCLCGYNIDPTPEGVNYQVISSVKGDIEDVKFLLADAMIKNEALKFIITEALKKYYVLTGN